jgi:ATP adenylyltransferase
MNFDELLQFVERDMRMSHVYQPVMLRELLNQNGRATVADIARALLNEDRSQIEYYSEITKNMVGRVLTNRNAVKRDGGEYLLLGYENLDPDQVQRIKAACEVKLSEYLARRGDAIWEHRRRSAGYISGTLRYEVLKNAKFRCELCGIPADERALEVDHITPRNNGGTDEIANLQALCFSCNAMKRDRDDTDFRAARREYDRHEQGCPFCSIPAGDILIENRLSVAVRDKFPVTDWHILVIPKRHTADYFDLGTADTCLSAADYGSSLLCLQNRPFRGGLQRRNQQRASRRSNCDALSRSSHSATDRDHPNPRGGVRAVIPSKGDYIGTGIV